MTELSIIDTALASIICPVLITQRALVKNYIDKGQVPAEWDSSFLVFTSFSSESSL